MPVGKPLIILLLVSCVLCLFLINLGPTLLLTLSLVFHQDNLILTIVDQFSTILFSVYLSSLEGIFLRRGCNCPRVFRLSSPVHWPDSAGKSGLGVCPSLCDLSPSSLLVLSPPLDRVHSTLWSALVRVCCYLWLAMVSSLPYYLHRSQL